MSTDRKCRTIRARGFALLEAILTTVLVSFIGLGAFSVMTQVTQNSRADRWRSAATADAQFVLQMGFMIARTASASGGAVRMCEAMTSAGAPMDTTTGGTQSGSCPAGLTVTGIPVPGNPALARQVTLTTDSQGVRISVTVTGGGLPRPVAFSALVSG